MQLGRVAEILVLIRNRQPFIERVTGVTEASGLCVRVPQHGEVRRNANSGSRGPEVVEPLEQKWQPLLPILQKHSCPLVKRPQCVPELKALFRCNRDFFGGCGLDLGSKATVMAEKRGKVYGVSETEGVADCSGKLARLAIHPECLVRIPKVPQGQGQVATMSNPRIVAGIGRPESGELSIVVAAQCLLVVRAVRPRIAHDKDA